jgi:hypothetical protein
MVVYMVVLTVRTGLCTDQGLAGVTVDILIDSFDIDIDVFTVIKDRIEAVLIIIESQPSVIFPYDKLMTAVVLCQDRIEDQFIVSGKDIGVFKRQDQYFVTRDEVVDKAAERLIADIIA